MKMIIAKEKSNSAKSSPRYNDDTKSPRITSTASFFLNPPKPKLKQEKVKLGQEAITSLVDNVINQAARNIQSSGSSINLNNQMMSSSLSSSSGLVEGSSRSSSSIDTGSNTNTDELLNAGTDLIVNNSDLSGSSRRSSINDIGMDVDLETEFFQKSSIKADNSQISVMSNLYIKNNMSADDTDKTEPFKVKSSSAKETVKVQKANKKQRQNNYFNRSRRGRIVKTPPIEWSQINDDDDKISDQLDSPRSEKVSEELYDYYLKNRNLNLDKDEEDDHFNNIKTNYTSIESLKMKFDTPNHQKSLKHEKMVVSNWLSNSYNDPEERNLKTPDNDQLNDSANSHKKGFFPKSPQQQQDKPVFKYLSKNLINNLFVKEPNNEPTTSPSKVKSKFLTDDQQNTDNIKKPLSITTTQEKVSPSSINYNYLIKKYSPAAQRGDSKPQQFNKLSSETNKLDTTKKINSSIVSIIKDLVSDAIDETSPKPTIASAATKAENRLSDELEVAVTVELESDEDVIDDNSLLTYSKLTMNHLSINPNDDDDSIICDDNTYKNTELNRGYLSPRERINAVLNEESPPQQQRPLIKTLINDITKLKSDTYLTSCLDYLNENFNKTLDDLVELEDTKKPLESDLSIMSNPESNKTNNNSNSLLLDLRYDAIKLSNDSLNSSNQKRQISSGAKNEENKNLSCNEINLIVKSKHDAILSNPEKEELSRDSTKETASELIQSQTSHNKNNNDSSTFISNNHNNNNNSDPIDLNYLNNYAKLYVQNVQNLHESESTEEQEDNYKCAKNHNNNNIKANNNSTRNEKANHTTTTIPNKKNNANITSEEHIPAQEKQPQVNEVEEEEHLKRKEETKESSETIRIDHEASLQASDSKSTSSVSKISSVTKMLDSCLANEPKQEDTVFICKRIPSANCINETIPEEELNSSSIISDVIDSEEEGAAKVGADKPELETGKSIEADIESNVNEAIDSLINQLDNLHSIKAEQSDLVLNKKQEEEEEKESFQETKEQEEQEAVRLKVNKKEAQPEVKINVNDQAEIVNDFKSHGLSSKDEYDNNLSKVELLAKSHEGAIVNDLHLNKQQKEQEKEELEQENEKACVVVDDDESCSTNTNSESLGVLSNNEAMNNNLDNPFKNANEVEDLNESIENLPSKSTSQATLPNNDIYTQQNDLTQQKQECAQVKEVNELITQEEEEEEAEQIPSTADISKDATLTPQITNLTATANEPVNNNTHGDDINSNLDESELSINRLSAIERISHDEENKIVISGEKLSSLEFNEDEMNSTNSTNQDQDDSIMNTSDLDVTSGSTNVKKVILKNKEIVLVESCSDDDEEELKRIIHRKNVSPAEELFPHIAAQERRARKPRPLPTLSPLDLPTEFNLTKPPLTPSTFAPSTTSNSSYLNSSRKTDTTNSSNDEDDPFVKAALERFDAFCKSKSTQNLDTAGVTTPSPSPIITQRQKSPFLTRKIITQPNEDPKMKESIGSFIKRRQARIDPNLLHKNASSTPNGSDSESKSSKPPIFSRSVSETREPHENLFGNSRLNNDSLKQQQAAHEPSVPPLASSSLAKRFLGSLTPQLEPMKSEPSPKPQLPITPEPIVKEEPEMPVRKSVLQAKVTKNEPSNSTHMINRTSSAPSAMPLNLRSNHERRCSTSSNSSTDSESKTPRGGKNNVIKLEVVNGQKMEKTPSPEKSNFSKPPLPPVATSNASATSHSSTVNAGAWRSSAKATESSQETVVTEPKAAVAKTDNLVSKPPSSKPGVRMIPLEVKNTKSRMIPLEVKTNGTTISRSNSKSEKVLNNSFNVTPPVPNKAIEKNGFLTATNKAESPTTVDSRPRSLSSFRIERESSGSANLRNASSFSYRDSPSLSSGLSTSHSGNLNNNPEFSRGLPTEPNTKSTDDNADPIVEKACSNFMYKLMEFQRHQKPYLPSTTTPTAIAKPEYSTSSTLLSATASPSASSSNLYSGPIVSSRTSTMSDYTSSRFTDNAALSVPATPLLGSSTTANVPYSAPYMSSYSNNFSFPSSSASLTRYSGTENIYKTDLSKFAGESNSDSPRPYVSAIRKRRTLFDDMQSGGDNQEALTNQYLIPQNYSSNKSLAETDSYLARQRPLSIVSEEVSGGYHPLTRSLSAKGDSRLSNEMNKSYMNQNNQENTTNGSSTYKLSRPPLKKSNSTTSAENQKEQASNGTQAAPSSSSTQPKLRSTVFDRLAALNNSNSSKLSSNKTHLTNSNLNLNLETPETSKKSNSKSIKDQNEIAIVTNMTPATSKKDLSQYSSTNSAATLNRIRSLDSKSRDKLRNKDYTKKAPSTSLATSTKLGKSHKDLSDQQPSRRLKSASNALPPAAPTSSSSNSSSPTPSNFNSNSNPSFESNSHQAKTITTSAATYSTSTATTPRTDVFERLSKRTNSLKNLANNNSNNNHTNATTTSTLRKKTSNRSTTNSSSSSDHDTDGKCSPPVSHNEATHQNTVHNSHTNSLSKTSVFERLYKSNIAAHQSLKNTEQQHAEHHSAGGSFLKKNMSNSTASLASSTPSTSSNLSRKSNLTPRGRAHLTKSKAVNKVKTDEDEASKTQDELEDHSISSN